MDDLKVVIIGAGMGGLATGIALRQVGYQVEIYDRVSELRPAGAGISHGSRQSDRPNRRTDGSNAISQPHRRIAH